MTNLRKRMLEELQRRNYSSQTIRAYLFAVKDFATYFGKRPDLLRQEHLREYQLHLLNDRKLTVDTIVGRIAALRFFFVRVLRRRYREIDLVYPKRPERLPRDLERRGSGAVDRIGSYFLPSRDSDDLVRSGIAPRGTLPIEGDRCRWPTHGASRSSRQRSKGSRRYFVTETAGSSTRLLEVAETQDISVSQLPWQTTRTTDQFKNGVLRGLRSSAACRNPEKGVSAFAAPQLGNPPIGAWDGSEVDSDAARSLRFGSDDDLSSSFTTASTGRQ